MLDSLANFSRKLFGSFSQTIDREDGIDTVYHYDAVEDKHHFETKQDVEPLIELNKAQYNSIDERARWGEKLAAGKVASLPLWLYFDLKRQGIADDKKRFAAWLNDPANRAWRTRPGRV